MTRVARASIAVAVAACTLVPGSPAGAETTLEVEAGYAGGFMPGRGLPVRITVSADRLVSGTAQISLAEGGQTTTEVPVEVPGGSVKRFVVVVPTTEGNERATVNVVLAGARASATVAFQPDVELVGLLAGVRGADGPVPGPTPLAVDAGVARFAAIDDDDLAAAPGSLGPLGTLVAGADELATLDPAAQRGVLAWVERGGRLLVDALAGATVAGLPEQFQPGDARRATAGMGEVRLTDGAATAGRWQEILEPTPLLSPNQVAALGPSFGGEAVSEAIARDAGLRVAELGWLVFFLAGYVVLVGPVTFFVLRRLRRSDLAWVVVPVLAVGFAAVAFGAGRDLRQGTRAASATLVDVGVSGSTARSFFGLLSRNGGDGSVSFPAGWEAGAIDTTFVGGTNPTRVQVSSAPGRTDARVPLDAGQFGVLTARGAVQLDGGLEVTASAAGDGRASGVVRNTTRWTLEEVAVFVGRAGVNVGALAPGEERRWEVGPDSVSSDVFTPIEASVWSDELGFFDGRPDVASTVNIALWWEAVRTGGPNFRSTGTAIAAGWTRDYPPPAEVSGQGEVGGRTGLIARTAVVADAGGAIPDLAVRRDLLRGITPDDFGREDASSLYRFVLPLGASGATMELDVPDTLGRIEVWDGATWQVVSDVPLDRAGMKNPNLSHTVAVPSTSLRDGIVYARVAFHPDFGIFDASGLMLRAGA